LFLQGAWSPFFTHFFPHREQFSKMDLFLRSRCTACFCPTRSMSAPHDNSYYFLSKQHPCRLPLLYSSSAPFLLVRPWPSGTASPNVQVWRRLTIFRSIVSLFSGVPLQGTFPTRVAYGMILFSSVFPVSLAVNLSYLNPFRGV